jgi:ribonuclease HI
MLPLDPYALKIYIDGSALQNPGGAGGLAGIVVYPDDWNMPNQRIFEIGYQATTNQRMELLACLKAFEWIREDATVLRVQRVQIVTDSKYVYENRERATWWKQNGWRNASGKPVDNPDLWKEFLSARTKLRVRTDIVWQKGKQSPVLKEVDSSAKAASAQPWEIDRGFRSGKVGKSKLGGKVASTLFPAAGQEAVIHIYRSGVTGRDGHHVRFDLYSEQEKRFIAKHLAYTPAELSAELRRHHWYRVRFNCDPKHPIIEAILADVTPPSSP